MREYVTYKGRLYKSIDSEESDRFKDKQIKKALDEAFSYASAAHTQFKKVIEITGDRSYLSEVEKFYQIARQLYNRL